MAHFFLTQQRGHMKGLDQDIQRQLTAMVADEGLELLATEVAGSGPKTVVRLIVDGPDGVSLDQCADVSRQASAMLDVADPFTHAYTLEVSSPGVDRKLYSAADYGRFTGQRVKVRMKPSFREHRVVVGELIGFADDSVKIRTENETVELPLGEVFEARLDVDWEQIMKEGKSRP